LPPVSSVSWAENEVRFPVRFAKNRTSSVVYGHSSAITSASLLLFSPLFARQQQTRSLLTPFREPVWAHVE